MDVSPLYQTPTTTTDHDIEPFWSRPFHICRRRGGRKRSRRHDTLYTLSERSLAEPTWKETVASRVTQPNLQRATGHLDLVCSSSTSEFWRSTVSLTPTPSTAPRSIPSLMDLNVTPTPSLVCRCGRVAPPAKPSVRDATTSPINTSTDWDSYWSNDDSRVALSSESSVNVNQSPQPSSTRPSYRHHPPHHPIEPTTKSTPSLPTSSPRSLHHYVCRLQFHLLVSSQTNGRLHRLPHLRSILECNRPLLSLTFWCNSSRCRRYFNQLKTTTASLPVVHHYLNIDRHHSLTRCKCRI